MISFREFISRKRKFSFYRPFVVGGVLFVVKKPILVHNN
jgi:hypothetical protein